MYFTFERLSGCQFVFALYVCLFLVLSSFPRFLYCLFPLNLTLTLFETLLHSVLLHVLRLPVKSEGAHLLLLMTRAGYRGDADKCSSPVASIHQVQSVCPQCFSLPPFILFSFGRSNSSSTDTFPLLLEHFPYLISGIVSIALFAALQFV